MTLLHWTEATCRTTLIMITQKSHCAQWNLFPGYCTKEHCPAIFTSVHVCMDDSNGLVSMFLASFHKRKSVFFRKDLHKISNMKGRKIIPILILGANSKRVGNNWLHRSI